jgi:hypothetical protein
MALQRLASGGCGGRAGTAARAPWRSAQARHVGLNVRAQAGPAAQPSHAHSKPADGAPQVGCHGQHGSAVQLNEEWQMQPRSLLAPQRFWLLAKPCST